MAIESFVGRTFGWVEVIAEAPRKPLLGGQRPRRVVVQCRCGTLKIVRLAYLRAGRSTSCGCRRRHLMC